MIVRVIKNFSLVFLLITSPSSWVSASDRVTGQNIKEQAAEYFVKNNLSLTLLVSDKRSFFPCSTSLNFTSKYENDWSTVLVSCTKENWETFIRTTGLYDQPVSSEGISNNEKLSVAVVFKNISKGQVITKEYLHFENRPEGSIHGAYTDISEVLGRKTKSNIAAGTILKARHLDTTYSVDKNDNVLVIAENKAITITTSAIALEKGQLGDMISVKNVNSEKVFKVIITGKKKVAPITNM